MYKPVAQSVWKSTVDFLEHRYFKYFNDLMWSNHTTYTFQNMPTIHTDIFWSLQEDQDWGFVAMVLDRLFLWLFTTASLFGTFSILCEAPALWVFLRMEPRGGFTRLKFQILFHSHFFHVVARRYDDTRPIDIEYSIIAQKLFNLTVKDH